MAEATPIVYRRVPMYDKQRAFVDCQARYVVVEASTKTGKTVSLLVWLLEQALAGRLGQNFWWVAPSADQSRIAFRRLHRWLQVFSASAHYDIASANLTLQTLTLANGAVIWFKTGEKPDLLYGEDVFAAVLDEATRMREDAWFAVRSTLTATGGKVRIIGNVKGRKNWAYQMARRAESGEEGMAHFRLTAFDAAEGLAKLKAEGKIPASSPAITVQDIEDARLQLPDSVFRELYLAEPSDDEGNPFGLEAIRACQGGMSSAAPYVWGVDLAKRVDWTVAVALDSHGRVCRLERWRNSWDFTLRQLRHVIGEDRALIDKTGVGDPIVELLRREVGGNITGYHFSPISKQQLMEGLAVAFQRHEIQIPKSAESSAASAMLSELEGFEYVSQRDGTVRYSAPQGQHDDCVIALALAWRNFSEHRMGEDWGVAYGIWVCTGCEQAFAWKAGRPCPRCGQKAPETLDYAA